MDLQQHQGPRGLIVGGALGFVAIVAMGVPDAGRQVLKEETLRLYHAVRPDQPAPLTTGSIGDKPKTATKKPVERDAFAQAWQAANYALSLCWLDDHCREQDAAHRRNP